MSAITFQKATKAQLKGRIALDGPSGAGKTWTALTTARTLVGPDGRILLIDTERGSGALYSDEFNYDYFRIDPPYNPARGVEVLAAGEAERYDCIILDSMSHFWEGEGGTLDIVDAAAQRSFQGNTYAGWSIGTPALRSLVDALLGLDAHLVVTMRSKMEHVLETNQKGQQVPRKVGMAPVMRNGVEYEFTIVGDMDLEHRIAITKSRCSALADQVIQPHHAAEMAMTFKTWLESGEPMATRDQIAEVQAIFATIADPETRTAKKAAFVDAFDKPERLFASQIPEALTYARELAGIVPLEAPAVGSEQANNEPAEVPPTETGASAPTPSSTPAANVPPGDGEAPEESPEDLLMDLELAIKGLPRAAQPGCRTELNKTFGNLSACSVEELHGAIKIVKGWPIGEPAPMTKDAPLSAKQRGVLAYAAGHGVDNAQVAALGALARGTHEPRPLHEMDDVDCQTVTALIDSVKSGEVVFEWPNGVLIAKEVVSS